MSLPDLHDGEIELRCGSLLARVRRELGGSLSGFWRMDGTAAVPILRPALAAPRDPREMSSFPLVPFCNRIQDGRFDWQGRTVQLPPNDPKESYPLHGYGWKTAWTVLERAAERVELQWQHAPGEWPWAFEVRQSIALTTTALEVQLSIVNTSAESMPAGLGHHPFFPLTPQTRFAADVEFKCETNARLIPIRAVPVQKGGIFGSTTPHGTTLDNTFLGWQGPAVIEQRDPPVRIELTAEPQHPALGVWVLRDSDFLCVEPLTHAPNALGDPATSAPMRALAPGERMHSTLRIAVT